MALKMKTPARAQTWVVASLLIAWLTAPAIAEKINAGPVWELGLGVEHVSVSFDPADEAEGSGWGGQPVFMRGSWIGSMTRSASDGRWMLGEYLALGIGGWYGDQGYIRVPLDLGIQGGMVIASEYQVVARAGVMGVGTGGGNGAGGFGTYFYSLRGKWQDFALEGGFGLRKDTEEGGAAGTQFLVGRWYISDINLGVRFTNATRRIDPPSKNTLTDRTILMFASIEI